VTSEQSAADNGSRFAVGKIPVEGTTEPKQASHSSGIPALRRPSWIRSRKAR